MGKKRYAPDEVMRAVSLVAAGGMSLRGAERATGVSRETIRRWRAELESGAGSLYAVAMGAGDRKEGPMDEGVRLDDLPDDPEELKRIIFDMQFEIDLTRAAVEILKKDPGADPGGALQQGEGGPGRRPEQEGLPDGETVFDQLSGIVASSRTSDFLQAQEEGRRGPGRRHQG